MQPWKCSMSSGDGFAFIYCLQTGNLTPKKCVNQHELNC